MHRGNHLFFDNRRAFGVARVLLADSELLRTS